jgi:hypothetical protein
VGRPVPACVSYFAPTTARSAGASLRRIHTKAGQANAAIVDAASTADTGRSKNGRIEPSDLISEVTKACSTMVPITMPTLAYSHDLLVQNEWQGATLEELLRVQVAPFGGFEGGRFVAQGPRVDLRPQAMQSLGLILHELATNATKHGALSNPIGTVAIGWARQDDGVRLTWEERGGPPVTAPARKGFGQVVFERTGASLEGSLTTDFRPDGFRCTIDIGAVNLLKADLSASPGARSGTAAQPDEETSGGA